MDLENQRRVKSLAEQYGPENIVVLLGAAEGEAAGLAAETVTNGDPTFAGPLTGVQLGLRVYHVCEPEVKAQQQEPQSFCLPSATDWPEKLLLSWHEVADGQQSE